jgi:biotin operon repressor
MKFYKLTEADLPLIFEMNESELKVYCWLNVHLPFDDSKAIEIDTAQLAEEIGISRRSVQRALKSLESREIFDIEITKAKVKRMTTQMSRGDTDVAETTLMSPKRHSCRRNDTHVAETTLMSRSQPETPTPSDFQEPKTLKTNKTQKTLSEERERDLDFCLNKIPEVDREKFLWFARLKASQLPNPPQLVEKWIATYIDWIKQEFDKAYPQDPLPTEEDKNSAATPADRFFEELHPAVKEGLSSGEISRLDWAYNGLFDSQGNWWKIDDWLDRDESPTTQAAAQTAIAALRQRFSTRREV